MSALVTSSEESEPAPEQRLTRQGTNLDAKPTPEIIQQFVEKYAMDHWSAVAQHARDLLQEALDDARTAGGQPVLAKLSSRAKSQQSLTEKLKVRYYKAQLEGKAPYGDKKDIWEDIADLAGVRVVLYIPDKDQHQRVREAIQEIWGNDVKPRRHPDPEDLMSSIKDESDEDCMEDHMTPKHKKPHQYKPRHTGYQAVHFRAPMKYEAKSVRTSMGLYHWMKHDRVEIQVVSALVHVWAEVEHDVRYKTDAYGPPTEEEERLLDTLSGLVSSAELLLEQFSKSVNKRSYAKISYRDDFGTFLRELDVLQRPSLKLEGGEDDRYLSLFGSEGINILFRFLVKRDLNYPRVIRDALMALHFPDDPEPKLQEQNASFQPALIPPANLLAPLCLIHFMLLKHKSAPISYPETRLSEKCGILINALTLLQTFAGGPDEAKEWLRNNIEDILDERQRNSLNFILSSTRRRICLTDDSVKVQRKCSEEVLPVWTWFQKQAQHDNSICGTFFQLAEMDHEYKQRTPTKESDAHRLLTGLEIGSLSRSNTTEQD